MMFRIDALQPIKGNVRVNLRGRNVGVPEDGLYCSEVGTIFDHVRGTAVTQHVRAGMTSSTRRRCSNHLPHALASELLRIAGDE